MTTTQSEDVRLLVALTNLLLSQLAELRRLRADSEAAVRPLTELLDGIADGVEQTANEVTARLSRALAAEGDAPAATAAGNVGRPRRGVDEGPWIRGFS